MRYQPALSISILAIAAGAIAVPVNAQESAPGETEYHSHDEHEGIVVTAALPVRREDVLSGVAVLHGDRLDVALRSSIGDTLTHTPGVTATSFGPNASRPVLRGLQGERVRVLTDGVGSIDVSNTSVDHASAVNPLLAERIEVLRGPQSLRYGSAAIGGVVNVIGRRIPIDVPDEAVHLGLLAAYGSASNEWSGSASADLPLGGGFVAHFDGSYAKSDDMRIGGYALSDDLRSQALASSLLESEEKSEIDFASNAEVRGRLPNTAARNWNAGIGVAYIGERGSLGVAYSRYDNHYGVPLRFATQSGQGQEAPTIQLRQDRIDARGEVETGGALIDKLAFRYAYGNYVHDELEEDGAIGTSFFSKGMEGRFELVQTKRGPWRGVSGVQFMLRDFNVVGEEAYLPRNTTSQFGIFTLQELDLDALRIEAGARFEHTLLRARPEAGQDQFFGGEVDFDTLSASLGASYEVASRWKAGFNLSRAARAPSAEESFANGPHAGTEAFEVGNPALSTERAWSVEAILRGEGDGFNLEASLYHSWFSNFIYDAAIGDLEDGLPVYEVHQADARHYGFEVQGTATLAHLGGWKLAADALADYVHATISGVGPAPRIPPLRLLGGLELTSGKFDLRGEVERVWEQARVAANETATAGYTMVNAQFAWRLRGAQRPISLTLAANNIFNVNARRHASFLKDYAPLAGRDIRLTARMEF